MNFSLPGFSVHGISQARILEFPFPSPGDLPDPGIELVSPALAGRFFTTEPPGKPRISMIITISMGQSRGLNKITYV